MSPVRQRGPLITIAKEVPREAPSDSRILCQVVLNADGARNGNDKLAFTRSAVGHSASSILLSTVSSLDRISGCTRRKSRSKACTWASMARTSHPRRSNSTVWLPEPHPRSTANRPFSGASASNRSSAFNSGVRAPASPIAS